MSHIECTQNHNIRSPIEHRHCCHTATLRSTRSSPECTPLSRQCAVCTRSSSSGSHWHCASPPPCRTLSAPRPASPQASFAPAARRSVSCPASSSPPSMLDSVRSDRSNLELRGEVRGNDVAQDVSASASSAWKCNTMSSVALHGWRAWSATNIGSRVKSSATFTTDEMYMDWWLEEACTQSL